MNYILFKPGWAGQELGQLPALHVIVRLADFEKVILERYSNK